MCKRKYTLEQREQNRIRSFNYRRNSEKKEIIQEYKKTAFIRNGKKLVKLRKEKGNKCVLCGYNDELRILEFHHLRDKSFTVGANSYRSIKELREEIKKCVLLCPNCHRKIHLR